MAFVIVSTDEPELDIFASGCAHHQSDIRQSVSPLLA